uniref:NADH-ubiquinone oxidoreductase chain 4 n=1 Tax=Solanum lycopersicum TaxID=4081 RepID=A0A3Q7IFM5_SOLLC
MNWFFRLFHCQSAYSTCLYFFTPSSCRGTYDMIRHFGRNCFKIWNLRVLIFSIPMLPEETTTLRLIDLKKIIGYSSVAHMNLVTVCMFSREAAVILPILIYGHISTKIDVKSWTGFFTIFICVGVLYNKHKTHLVRYYRGSMSTMTNLSTIFFFHFGKYEFT